MKTLIYIIFGIIFSFNPATAQTFSFEYEGISRSYILHLPTSYTTEQEYPLVLNFHGLGSNAIQQQGYTQMDLTANQNDFIVVYPEGIDNAWNTGLGFNNSINDVGFINALLDTLIKNYTINQSKIYSCGMSMGGFFTNRLACELSNRIAAFASVTGLLSTSTDYNCNPSKAIPIMFIHGTNDPTVDYNGSPYYRSAPQTIQHWVEESNCAGNADTTAIPNSNTADNSTVELIKYMSCESQVEVWLYKVNQGGHTWPGGIIDLPSSGNTNRDINASAEIWNFFNKFSLPLITNLNEKSDPAISIYPNPASDFIFINYPDIEHMVIFDISGKKVSGHSDYTDNKIDIRSLNKGLYYIKIFNPDGHTFSTNFIKN